MNKPNTDVVICGLVRDKERLLKKIDQYVIWQEARLIDKIIFSTWIGEIDNHKGLRKELQVRNVVLIEIVEPKLVLKGGHQLHQMTSFYYGLSLIEDSEKFVLKTRVDLADNTQAMEDFFIEGSEVTNDFLNIGITNKIIVENAQMIYPFLCGDAQFFGKKKDLQKLINMSNEMEIIFNRLAVEQTFFFEPFKKLKIFREHFYWNLPHISEISNKRDEQIMFIKQHEQLLDVFKLWWKILDAYFVIGWHNQMEFKLEFNSLQEAFDFDNVEYKLIGGDKSDVITSSIFVKALLNLFKQSKFSSDNEQSSNPFNINPVIFNMYEEFRKKFSDLPSPKATTFNTTKYLIDGAAQHFFVKDSNDKASTRYHEQVTALRRENDILRKELNIRLSHSTLHKLLNRLLSRKVIEFFKYRLSFIAKIYAKFFMHKKV